MEKLPVVSLLFSKALYLLNFFLSAFLLHKNIAKFLRKGNKMHRWLSQQKLNQNKTLHKCEKVRHENPIFA